MSGIRILLELDNDFHELDNSHEADAVTGLPGAERDPEREAASAYRPLGRWVRRYGLLIVAVLGGLTVGFIVRGFLPPFVLDEPFWRDFLSGPPAAGLFALGGACVAYAAARVAARTSRRGDEREEWWARAEWALNLARSDKKADRLIGLRALQALGAQATETEYEMVLSVTEAVTGDIDDVDTGAGTENN